MPRAGAVGRRDDYGNAPHHEEHQPCHPAQRSGKSEAIKRKVKMQEITCPNGCRIHDIEPGTVHLTDRHAPYPHVLYQSLYPGKDSQIPNHPYQEHQRSHDTSHGDVEVGRSEQMQEKSPVGTCYPKETGKDAGLQHQGHAGYQQDTYRID